MNNENTVCDEQNKKSTKWTEEQFDAIETTGSDILVNAAAGSGKTAVLVERIIKKITDTENNTDVDSLLVVTFTKAAAAEMRERISLALTEALRKNTKDENLRKQLMLLNYADITTIDAFCQSVVRNNFHLIGLDPNFSIADETTLRIMKDETIEEVFDELYDELYSGESENSGFRDVVNMYSKNRSDARLKEMILKIYEFIATLPDADGWLDTACGRYDLKNGFSESIFCKIIMERAEIYINECINELDIASAIMQKELETYKSTDEEGLTDEECITKLFGKYYECITEEKLAYTGVKSAIEMGDWNLAVNAVRNVEYKRMTASKAESVMLEILKEHRENAKTLFSEISSQLTEKTEIIEKEFSGKLYPIINTVADIVKRFKCRFAEKKHSKNLYGFDDIEHFCLKLLRDENGEKTVLAKELEAKYSEILLDEYQDSNDLQEAIFTSISNGRNMFMVGDMKQSIYRFRNADPTLFKNKCESYSAEKGADFYKITLSKNFRSRKCILDTVNSVFEAVMTRNGVGEIDYDDEQRLNPGAGYYYSEEKDEGEEYKTELLIASDTDENGKVMLKESGEAWSGAELEALMLAQRLKKLKESGFQVTNKDGTKRELRNRDIAILVRAKTNGVILAEALKSVGIEAYVESEDYFNKPEIILMLSLLKVLVNPTQDIPMLAVMRSVIGNFSDDELAEIRMCSGGSIYSALLKYGQNSSKNESVSADGQNIDITLADKCAEFLENISRWRKYSEYMSCDKLIWTLYTETDYYAYTGALSGGEEAQANLRLLFERAKNYEGSGFKGLFNFINLIKSMIKRETNLSPAKLITEKHDVVRIMTIHKSKGLEFPVTVIANMFKSFREPKPRGDIILHKGVGFGMEYIDYKLGYNYPTVSKMAVENSCQLENLSEEMRILYVAMTRAREKLIVSGCARADKINKWMGAEGKISTAKALSADNFMDWVGPVAINSPFWTVIQKNADEITASWTEEDISKKAGNEDCDEWTFDAAESFDYKYPYELSGRLPSKISVTELKRRAISEMEEDVKEHNMFADENDKDFDLQAYYSIKSNMAMPEFMKEKKDSFTGAQRGTIIHAVMENIKFKADIDDAYVLSELEEMVQKGILTDKERETVDAGKITAFFKSELGRKIEKADECFKEVPFEIAISVCEVDKTLPDEYKNEEVILQGIIDGYFEEDGEIVLFDYKTDRYTDKSEIAEKYKIQLEYYKMAIEKILGKKVKESILYLFYKDELLVL